MESESTVLMVRAVLISVLLHVLVIYLMSLFFPTNEAVNEFSSLKVYMFSRSDSPGTAIKADKTETIEVSAVEDLVQKKQQIPVEKLPPEIPVLQDVPEDLPDLGETTKISGAADAEDVHYTSEGSHEAGEAEALPVQGNSPAESSGPSGGSSKEALDVKWTGVPAKIRVISEPSFSLPYGADLPDEVRVSFEVLRDGTSFSVKILPPGSGYLNLDQQIRSYVSSLIFESFRDGDDTRKGLLTLYLRHQDSGP